MAHLRWSKSAETAAVYISPTLSTALGTISFIRTEFVAGWQRRTYQRAASSNWIATFSSISVTSAPTRFDWRAATRRRIRIALRERHVGLAISVSARRLPRPESRHGVAVRRCPWPAGKNRPGGYQFAAAVGTRAPDIGGPGRGCGASSAV